MVLVLAGKKFQTAETENLAAKFAQTTATMNPVAMLQFFDTVCKEIFECLLAANSETGGLFGPIATYFGMVETNN